MTKQTEKGYVPHKVADLSRLPKIKGYDFESGFDFKKFLNAYATTGIQGSKLGSAIEIVKAMQRENSTIFLSYSSNMVSSGIRDIICYLVKRKKVHVLITNAGGIEEDMLKCFDDFALGNFDAHGAMLKEQGINRIGNIFVTDDFYAHYELEMRNVFEKCYQLQKEKNRPLCTSEIIYEMGAYMEKARLANREKSIIYWAYKNQIPIFSPAFTDGSTGDLIYFFRHSHKDFYVDITQDMDKIISISLNAEKTGVINLGGGSAKHYSLNAQIFREGADFAISVNTHGGYDASDSGAEPDEAVSWAKIKPHAPSVKVTGDASIIFPLIVAGSFALDLGSTKHNDDILLKK